MRAREEVVERLEPEVAHPLRLGLELRDLLDDLAVQPLGRLVQVVLGVVEAVALRVVGVDPRELLVLGQHGRCGVDGVGSSHYSTSSLIVSSSMITGNVSTGTYAGRVLGLPVLRSNSEPCRGHSTVHVCLVELALDERAVVVRAAVLDRVHGAGAVEHADLEVLPLDQALLAGRRARDSGQTSMICGTLIEIPSVGIGFPGESSSGRTRRSAGLGAERRRVAHAPASRAPSRRRARARRS